MILYLLVAVSLGASVAFAIVTDFWKDSNEIGSSDGNDVYFSNQFTVTDGKNRIRIKIMRTGFDPVLFAKICFSLKCHIYSFRQICSTSFSVI